MKQILLFTSLFIFIQVAKSQVSYTWNGSISTSWNNPGNWTPNGIPGAADNVTVVTGGNTCALNAGTLINNFTLTSGTLDMAGFTLTVNGPNAIFNLGTVQNGGIIVQAATTTTFGAGPVTMNCKVNVISLAVTFKNTTFQDVTTITKTGPANDICTGNNVFNGATTITNLGSGYLMLGNGNPDHFNSATTFNNVGSNAIYIADNSAGNVFNGVTTFKYWL